MANPNTMPICIRRLCEHHQLNVDLSLEAVKAYENIVDPIT